MKKHGTFLISYKIIAPSLAISRKINQVISNIKNYWKILKKRKTKRNLIRVSRPDQLGSTIIKIMTLRKMINPFPSLRKRKKKKTKPSRKLRKKPNLSTKSQHTFKWSLKANIAKSGGPPPRKKNVNFKNRGKVQGKTFWELLGVPL